MGPGPPWSPRAPPKLVPRTVCAPSCPAPVGVTAGGLAWVRTSGGVGLCGLLPGAPMPGRVLLHHSRPLCGGGGGSGCPRPLLEAWHPCIDPCWRRLGPFASPPPPPPCAQPCRPCSTWRTGRSTALLRRGAGMPDVPPGAAVPNPPSHRSACGALSVFVCRANAKAWQSGMLLRASGLSAALWRREKRCPCIWYGAVLWFHDLVLWASAGPLRYDGARVEIIGIRPGRLLGSSFPRAPLLLTQAVTGRR